MYKAEYWALNKNDEMKIEVAEMRMYKGMCEVTWLDRIRNEYIIDR